MQTANVNVPVQVTGRHVSVTESIKDYALKKVEHLHLDYPRIIDAQVILDVEKHRHFAEIILHCKAGLRSAKALAILRQAGFNRLKNLTGGIDRWAREIDPSLPRY